MSDTNNSKAVVSRNFVTFYSPGTFVPEETTLPIDKCDIDTAIELSSEIVERYGARPFGFRFSVRGRANDELDSKELYKSPMYYLGGTVLTLTDVEERNDPKDDILIRNMKDNNIERVVVNDNSWRSTFALNDGDIVLPTPQWATER